MEKVLKTCIYCARCNCVIKDEELAEWECGQCDTTDNWEHIEIVARTVEALSNVNKACEKTCTVESEIDEY